MNEYLGEALCLKRIDGQSIETEIALTNECALEIVVNDWKRFATACSPVEIVELAIGRLATEGMITDVAQIERIECDLSHLPDSASVAVVIGNDECRQAMVTESVCWEESDILALWDHAMNASGPRGRNHGTHSCTLMRDKKIVCSREDIGRHNAIDRAVGYAIKNGVPPKDCIAYFSGRVSCEAVRKAHNAGINVFCGKALPTKQAVELAREKGMILLHYAGKAELLRF